MFCGVYIARHSLRKIVDLGLYIRGPGLDSRLFGELGQGENWRRHSNIGSRVGIEALSWIGLLRQTQGPGYKNIGLYLVILVLYRLAKLIVELEFELCPVVTIESKFENGPGSHVKPQYTTGRFFRSIALK